MPDFKNWIADVKNDHSTLKPFINRLDKFFSESGFNSSAFEKAVTKGLSEAENKAVESFTYKQNVESK